MTGHDGLILDACCVINLHASGRLCHVLSAIDKKTFITELVYRQELLSIQSLDALCAKEQRLQTALDKGLIEITDFTTETEQIDFIDYAAILRGDGEAATFAVAAGRNYAVATDDKKARNFVEQQLGHLRMVSTLELLKLWADTFAVHDRELRQVMINIRDNGPYTPPRAHLLYQWWLDSISS